MFNAPIRARQGAWVNAGEILLHKVICNKRDLRKTGDDLLYRMRTGCPWRDVRRALGYRNQVDSLRNAVAMTCTFYGYHVKRQQSLMGLLPWACWRCSPRYFTLTVIVCRVALCNCALDVRPSELLQPPLVRKNRARKSPPMGFYTANPTRQTPP